MNIAASAARLSFEITSGLPFLCDFAQARGIGAGVQWRRGREPAIARGIDHMLG
jgi:hypothetical protein